MNSMSKGYYDSCGKGKEERKEDKCPTIIKCSTPDTTGSTVAAAGDILATLRLNTSCLCEPCVKVDFTGDFILPDTAFSITLQLEKVCSTGTTPIGPIRTISGGAGAARTLPISYFACDCPCDCPRDCDDYCDWADDCCIYRVRVAGAVTGTVGYNNTTLSAIATCKKSCGKKHHCRKDY